MSLYTGCLLLILFYAIPIYMVIIGRSATAAAKGIGIVLVVLFSWIGYLIFHLIRRSQSTPPTGIR